MTWCIMFPAEGLRSLNVPVGISALCFVTCFHWQLFASLLDHIWEFSVSRQMCNRCSILKMLKVWLVMYVLILALIVKFYLLSYMLSSDLIMYALCFSMREDVFKNLIAVKDKLGESLESEAKRYLERLIKLGRRNGSLYVLCSLLLPSL